MSVLSVDEIWQQFLTVVHNRTGLVVSEHQVASLRREIVSLMGLGSSVELPILMQKLIGLPSEDPQWRRLIEYLTIGETYFFRNAAHFKALREKVLPDLIAERRANGYRQIRIWSAGCATGEEPYSLAILLRELIPDYEQWIISILGTDINEGFLQRAREGMYRDHSFRNETPNYVKDRWFTREPNGYRLDQSIRRMVQFRPLNLIRDDYPSIHNNLSQMDLIICRNVMIYFNQETMRMIVERFHYTLAEGGWFVMGHSESAANVTKMLKPRNFEKAILYQRVAEPVIQMPVAPVPRVLPRTQPLSTEKAVTRPLNRNSLVPMPTAAATPVPDPPRNDLERWWDDARDAANREDWETALQSLEQMDKRNRMLPQVHYLRGMIDYHRADMNKAISSFRRAIYCDPNFILAYYSLGDIFNSQGNVQEARRLWRSAQNMLVNLELEMPIPFGEDMTVEMMGQLLDYRLNPPKRATI